jgi:uncharacterized protein
MKLLLKLLLFTIINPLLAQTILPKVSSGKIERLENFQSKFVQVRNVDVWLPNNYDGIKKFSVLYMHDGQMLFDANTTWNKQEWKVDEVLSELIENKKIENFIVVAIWNTEKDRMAEYFPQKIFDDLSSELKKTLQEKYKISKPSSDAYLRFMVEELKPYIDSNYKVKTDRDNTFVMGSSMGGLISIYAISEYPKIFGGAACMSTAWLGSISKEIPTATHHYITHHLASSMEHRLYFDYGTTEINLDPNFKSSQDNIDSICIAKGFQRNINFKTEVITYGEHNEVSWAKRLNQPIEFLLPKKQKQQASHGKIDLYEDFQSNYVSERNIEVWLPENYSKNKKYSVLYMNDGQMLFDANTTWNKQTWDVDDTAQNLINEQKVKDFIVVGIWNAGNKRHENYFPQKPFEMLSKIQKDTIIDQLQKMGRTKDIFQPNSDNYLKFIVTELKPFIDKNYSTQTQKEDTFIAGSSMGGLISMYAICEYPNVFGGAACLSTHWPGIFTLDNNPVPDAFVNYLKKNLPNAKSHKIYFDYGDKTLDAIYPDLQKKVDFIMQEKGFTEINWITKYFPGDDHSEKSWRNRFAFPLTFLLSKKINSMKQNEKFQPLPFGSIKPSGWIKEQMQKDVDGFVGNLDKLVPDLINDPIYNTGRLHKNSEVKDLGNLKEGDKEGSDQYKWWNSETQSNWWDSYIRNTILLNDKAGLAKVEKYIQNVLNSQDDDGYIGIYDKELRYNFNSENGELWSKATMYRGLLAYYEYSKDKKVWQALIKAIDNVMINYPIDTSSPFSSGKEFNGGVSHGLTFTDVLDKMYQITGDTKYTDYALFLYEDFSRTYQSEKDVQLENILNPNYKLQSHGVHTYEHLRPLIVAAYASKNIELQKALDIYIKRIEGTTTLTGGAIGDEWIAERNADATHTGYEYCSLHELLDSYSVLFQKQGNPKTAEVIETIFYNAAQGSRNPNHSCIAYLKTDNSFEMEGTKNGEEEPDRKQTRYKYSAAHQDVAVCCSPNAGRITPYFLEKAWLKEGDNVLVNVLLMPNTIETKINNQKVTIETITNYPYQNAFTFKISNPTSADLKIKIRKPSWVTEVITKEKYSVENEFLVFDRKLAKADEIKIEFKTKVQIKEDLNKEKYFSYGALFYARPIEAIEVKGKSYFTNFNDLMYKPKDNFRYQFIEENKADYNNGQISIFLKNKTTNQIETITLIPFGKTILRQVSF